MRHAPGTLTDERLKQTIDVLIPRAYAAVAELGGIRKPERYTHEELQLAVKRVVTCVARCMRDARPHTMSDLMAAIGDATVDEVIELLDAIDWWAFADAVRLCEGEHGCLTLRDSVLIVKSAAKACRGPELFAVDSPTYPHAVRTVLEPMGRLDGRSPPNNSFGVESSALLIEQGPGWTVGLRSAALPEGTKLDPRIYDLDVRDRVAEALWVSRGGEYLVDTEEIVRSVVIAPFFESVRRHGREHELPLPVESGCLQSGRHTERTFFVGGQLDLVLLIQRLGGMPFLDLPRVLVREQAYRAKRYQLVLDRMSLQGANCSFLTSGGEDLAGYQLTMAASTARGGARLPRRLRNIFRSVDPVTLALADVDPKSIEYRHAPFHVGRPRTPRERRALVWLLVRLELGTPTSGWGLVGANLNDDLVLRETIARAERHVQRMRPDGEIHTYIKHMQTSGGLQATRARVPVRRGQREAIAHIADTVSTRALLGR